MTPARSALWILAAVGVCACGVDVRPLEVAETDAISIVLLTTCHDEDVPDLVARLTETDTEVRISDVDGTASVGDDCQGLIRFELDAPIGDRAVVVNGATWQRVDDDCQLARYISPDDAQERTRPLACDFDPD